MNRRIIFLLTLVFLLSPSLRAEAEDAVPAPPSGVPVPEYGPGDIPSLGLRKIRAVGELTSPEREAISAVDPRLIHWLKKNVSQYTGMPMSFYVPEPPRQFIYSRMGPADSTPAIIERNIVRDGIVIYDAALWQIVLTLLGGRGNLILAEIPVRHYWAGNMVNLGRIRSGHGPQNYIYDPSRPDEVSGEELDKGRRGFVFRVINANGQYLMVDPLDGKEEMDGFPNLSRIHWEDWKPIAGENAWVTMAALQLYHRKCYDPHRGAYRDRSEEPVELDLAKEIARAAMVLQADNGGVRMAPLGTFHNPPYDPVKKVWLTYKKPKPEDYRWHYYEMSTENNLSWYAAFRMLWEITGDKKYEAAMAGIGRYLKSVWNAQEHIFEQGVHYRKGQWVPNREHFAVDVQNFAIDALGPEWIDEQFGDGEAFRVWKATKERGGFRLEDGTLAGVGFTDEHDRLSIEWTGMAIMAAKILAAHYKRTRPAWAAEAGRDAESMRQGINLYKHAYTEDLAAYSYSSRRGWVPFGWFSHDPEVLSLSATCWAILNEIGFNPFYLPR